MFAPTPYPDEVLGSTLARACIWYGLRPTQLFKRVIRKSAQTSYFLPNSIQAIANWLGSTPEALLQEHTMLPYCAAFADASTRLQSPFFFSRHARESNCFRACASCMETELKELKESYWHRSHMLPGVTRCPVHNEQLLRAKSGAPHSCAAAMDFAMPHLCDLTLETDPGYSPQLLESWIAISVSTLSADWSLRDNWHDLYRRKALERGYVYKDRQIASAALCQDLINAFGRSFLATINALPNDCARASWPALLLRKQLPSGRLAAPKHICMASFLNTEDINRANFQYPAPGPAPRDCHALDLDGVEIITRLWAELRAENKRATVRSLMTRLRFSCLYRHQAASFPLTRALIERFRHSAQSERQVGRRN